MALTKVTPDMGGGTWEYISSVTASTSATVDFLSSFSSTYDTYMITWVGVVPVSDGSNLQMLVAITDTAQTGASYKYAKLGQIDSGTADNHQSTGVGYVRLDANSGTATAEHSDGHVVIHNVNDTTYYKSILFRSANLSNTPDFRTNVGGGMYTGSAAALTGCQFKMSTGNISVGTFRLYGLAKS